MDLARLSAESAIRNGKHSIALQKLATQIEAVSDRITSAMMMQGVAEKLGRAVPMLRSVVTGMDKLGMGGSVEQFQKVFEDLEVEMSSMTDGLDTVGASSTDQTEVDKLMDQIAAEQNLQIGGSLSSAGKGLIGTAAKPADSITERLAKLKGI